MCGIFGYVTHDGRGPDLGRLMRVAEVTERRGPHAFGFAWLDGRGRLRCYKQTGRISQHLPLLEMAADARLLIGHTRFATQGNPRDNVNNHPHPCDGGWLVHNGMIGDYTAINRLHDLHPTSDCDSETIALLAEAGEGDSTTIADRVGAALALIGPHPAAVLGLWRSGTCGGRLVAARRGNPLRYGATRRGIYMASLAEQLPEGHRSLGDGELAEFILGKDGQIRVEKQAIPKPIIHEVEADSDSDCPADEAGPAAPLCREPDRVCAFSDQRDPADGPPRSRTRPRYFGG